MKKVILIVLLFLYSFSFAGEIETRECIEQWNLRNIGIREKGYNRGKFIEHVQRLCNMIVGTAYCSCYVNAGFVDCGVDKSNLPVGSAWSPSWFYDRKKIIYKQNSLWNNKNWKIGDVFGLYYGDLGRIGHVGYVMYVNSERGYIITSEGNTDDSGNVWNPGDGIHSKKRSIKQISMVADYISTTTEPNVEKITYHYVQKKETLYRIAQTYDVTVKELMEWNGLPDNIIYLGQKLIIKK